MNNRNRGKNTGDNTLFSSQKQIDKLKLAIQDMKYLLSRNYAEKASSELVGNHYRLKARQIQALRGVRLLRIRFKIEKIKNFKFQI